MPAAQFLTAAIFVFLGFCFGFFFDLYRVLLRISTPGALLTVIFDLLFWLLYTAWIYIALLRLNYGEVRFYVLLSLAVGAMGYFAWLSRQMLRAWYMVIYKMVLAGTRMGEAINAGLDTLSRIVLWPYRILEAYVLRPLFALLSWLAYPLLYLVNCVGAIGRKWSSAGRRRWRWAMAQVKKKIDNLLTPPPADE